MREYSESAHAALAQLDRVFGYEPKGRGFESLTPCHKKTDSNSCLFFYASAFKQGIRSSEQNNPASCFENGDRRFLRDVSLDLIQNIEQKARRIPYAVPKTKAPKEVSSIKQVLPTIKNKFVGATSGRPRANAVRPYGKGQRM